jgi:hypothetical protein
MSPSGKLSVGIWKIRFREKWNMVTIIDDPNEPQIKIGPVDPSVDQKINGNQIQAFVR